MVLSFKSRTAKVFGTGCMLDQRSRRRLASGSGEPPNWQVSLEAALRGHDDGQKGALDAK